MFSTLSIVIISHTGVKTHLIFQAAIAIERYSLRFLPILYKRKSEVVASRGLICCLQTPREATVRYQLPEITFNHRTSGRNTYG